jgi:UDP-N-acetylmuramate dehydrogenase
VTGPEAIDWLANLAAVRTGYPLAPHTTYRIGGPADWYLEALNGLDLLASGCHRHGIPLTLLGNGSNLLIADDGVDGLVVRPVDTSIEVRGDVVVGAAAARMVKVAQAAERAGLTGMEWALGIPGTVGGSVHNNAGCFGSDIASTVVSVEGVSAAGEPATWTNAQCAFAYRTSALREGALAGGIVTAAEFQVHDGDPGGIRARMEEIQQARKTTQPVTGRSTGSVFKNPPDDFAGRLIEEAGLKGRRIGGAMVSREHANFIVNAGGATASEVAELVSLVQAAIEERFGIRLEPEIEVIGRWPDGVPEAFRVRAA